MALTTVELWERYAEAEFPTLRPRSQVLYAEYWRRWEVFAAPESIAEDLGPDTMARFRADLESQDLAPSTIGQTIRIVRMVYAWGFRHRLLARNDVREFRYKVAKEKRTVAPAEYRAEDFAALLAQLPLEGATTWRAHAVLALCGYQGVRQNAVLHLRWEDVDFGARMVTWRSKHDKVGREWTQPLRNASLVVLRAVQARAEGSPWVFPSGSAKSRQLTYSAQSLWAALRLAERHAKIPHLDRRGAHGLRRMLFNDVLERTQDIGTAMAAIGDTDLRVASKYLKRRDDRLLEAFRDLDGIAPKEHAEPSVRETPQINQRLTNAPRRNRTYNLAVQALANSAGFPGKTQPQGREVVVDQPKPPPNPESKQHSNGTLAVSRETPLRTSP
jgi:integrase